VAPRGATEFAVLLSTTSSACHNNCEGAIMFNEHAQPTLLTRRTWALLLTGLLAMTLVSAAPRLATPAHAACDPGPVFTTTPSFSAGNRPRAVTTGDLNADGRLDMVVINEFGSQLSVMLNTTAAGASSPSFAAPAGFVTAAGPRSVALGDFNGDGKPDIAVANPDVMAVGVLLNTTAAQASAPTFAARTDLPGGGSPFAVAAGDLNGDGKPDLAVANVSSSNTTVLLNTTPSGAATASFAGAVTFATGDGPIALVLGDLNGDGKLDLATANYVDANVTVLRNTTAAGAATPTFVATPPAAVGLSPQAIAARDLNGDGKLDLAVANVNDDTLSLLRNTTAGSTSAPAFASQVTIATGAHPQSVVAGDVNADGKSDLAVVNANDGTVSVMLNKTAAGATAFAFGSAEFASNDSPNSAALGDFDGDGKPDLAIASTNAAAVRMLRNTTTAGAATPSFTAQPTFPADKGPNSVAAGDLNGDGKLDLAVANTSAGNVSVLLNTVELGAATPSFAGPTNLADANGPYAVALGDLNGDGKLDLAVANNSVAGVSVFVNKTGTGATTPSFAAPLTFPTTASSAAVAVADFNADGKLDLVIANTGTGNVSVLLNTRTAAALSFSHKTFAVSDGPASVAVADFNADGRPDLATANYLAMSASVLLNTTAKGAATATFTSHLEFPTGKSPLAVAATDLNGDGRADLAIANSFDDTISVLRNTTAAAAVVPSFAAQTTYPVGDSPYAVAAADLNGDGRPELFATNEFSDTVSLYPNNTPAGASSFAFGAQRFADTGAGPHHVTTGDFNGDGRLDLVVTNFKSASVSALLNQSLPTSLSATAGASQSARPGVQFASALQVRLTDGCGAPMAGATITFRAPATGASAILSATTVTTDAQGRASVTARANGLAGRYGVTATLAGSTTVARFELINGLELYVPMVRR
jgi:hypothetical protein